MPVDERVMGPVMAGGEESRLNPLTAMRSKLSVPFGARYRIIDLVLSKLVKTDIRCKENRGEMGGSPTSVVAKPLIRQAPRIASCRPRVLRTAARRD